jgi:hypothetical protein
MKHLFLRMHNVMLRDGLGDGIRFNCCSKLDYCLCSS